jgi:hypothetical protein
LKLFTIAGTIYGNYLYEDMAMKSAIKRGVILSSVILILVSANPCPAQEDTQNFEETHKDKAYISLLYNISVELNEDYSFTTKMHNEVKILKEEAKNLGEIPIYYNKSREEITDLKAYTITPDGKRYEYSKVQDLNAYEGYGMYSDSMVKVITLPDVNVGSILGYEVTINTKHGLIKDAWWEDFEFNCYVPTKELNHTVTFPKAFKMHYKEFNLAYKPQITEKDNKITYSWHLRNLYEPRETEAYIPPTLEFAKNAVEFSTIKEWKDVSGWYYSLVQKNLIINKEIEEAALESIKGLDTIKDKARAILEYMQKNFRYVSMAFGYNALEPHPTDEVFRNKYGDCKDLSLLCMAMLKVCQIESSIALFNDEYAITDPKYDPPFPTLFNHVILLVKDAKDGDFYVDPLLKGYDIDQYPPTYSAAYTFIITSDGGRFDRFPIFDEKQNYSKIKSTVLINPDGSAITETENTWNISQSIYMRETLNAMDEESKKKFFEVLDASIAANGKMLDRRIDGLDAKYGALTTYTKYSKPEAYPITDDMIIIDLPGLERGTFFTEKERKYPVFYPDNALTENITIYKIPAGFKISHLPKNFDLDVGFNRVKAELIEKKPDEIVVNRLMQMRRVQIPKEDYQKVKDFFDQLPTKTTMRIVLKRPRPFWHRIKDAFFKLTKRNK